MNPTRVAILQALAVMSELYPHWRFGQTVANVSDWVVPAETQS